MKFALVASVPVLLAGCAIGGSWLDEIGKPHRPPVTISDERASELTVETAQLRARANELRALLALEPERRQRFRYYEDLRHIGDRLRPLQNELRDAGRPA